MISSTHSCLLKGTLLQVCSFLCSGVHVIEASNIFRNLRHNRWMYSLSEMFSKLIKADFIFRLEGFIPLHLRFSIDRTLGDHHEEVEKWFGSRTVGLAAHSPRGYQSTFRSATYTTLWSYHLDKIGMQAWQSASNKGRRKREINASVFRKQLSVFPRLSIGTFNALEFKNIVRLAKFSEKLSK